MINKIILASVILFLSCASQTKKEVWKNPFEGIATWVDSDEDSSYFYDDFHQKGFKGDCTQVYRDTGLIGCAIFAHNSDSDAFFRIIGQGIPKKSADWYERQFNFIKNRNKTIRVYFTSTGISKMDNGKHDYSGLLVGITGKDFCIKAMEGVGFDCHGKKQLNWSD